MPRKKQGLRIYHHKSRNGCMQCKRRRVKVRTRTLLLLSTAYYSQARTIDVLSKSPHDWFKTGCNGRDSSPAPGCRVTVLTARPCPSRQSNVCKTTGLFADYV